MKTVLYAYLSKEYLSNKGKLLGLKDDALAMFMHYNAVAIEVDVDEDTGLIIDEKIFDKTKI